jgi:hypothetical protein
MVSEARRLAARTFRSWGMDPEQAELGCLLVSEVVTNAVLHASITPSPGLDLDFETEPLGMPAPVGAAYGPGLAGPVPGHPADPGRPAGARKTAWSGGPGGADSPPSREFALSLRRGAASVWVEVFDPDLRLPRIRTAGETDEGGRGLYLVEQLATRWGSRPTPEGKAVWFEMPRSSQA